MDVVCSSLRILPFDSLPSGGRRGAWRGEAVAYVATPICWLLFLSLNKLRAHPSALRRELSAAKKTRAGTRCRCSPTTWQHCRSAAPFAAAVWRAWQRQAGGRAGEPRTAWRHLLASAALLHEAAWQEEGHCHCLRHGAAFYGVASWSASTTPTEGRRHRLGIPWANGARYLFLCLCRCLPSHTAAFL